MASKLREICTLSPTEYNLSRNCVANLGQSKILARDKDHQHNQKIESDSLSKRGVSKRTTKPNRITKFCKLCNSKGSTPLSSTSNVHELITRSSIDQVSTTRKYLTRVNLVDSELSLVNTAALPSTNDVFGHRCIESSLGSTDKQCGPVRKLVSRGTNTPFQSKRDAGHIICTSESNSFTKLHVDPHSMRQQNSSSPSTEGRRDEISGTIRNNVQNFEFIRQTPSTLRYTSYPRQIQQPCRPSVTSPTTTGVASSPRLLGKSVFQMGDSNDRPVRVSHGSCSPQLCVPRPERPSSPVSRRLQQSMALPSGLGISTSIPDPQSPDALESVDRNISNGSSTVGEGFLARRPENQSTCTTTNPETPAEISSGHDNGSPTTTSREHRPRSLEMWGWSEATKTWNNDQLLLLRNSWRKSTLKTYEVAWKRWLNWSKNKKIDPKNPTGSQLAQFLSDLYLVYNLSYNTILLHKSVVSTLCDAEKSSHLSSHVLVKHILKSIALVKPKCAKPPIWNVDELINFLKIYNLNENNTFQISRHAAILLLLCSGRRIHDLTLLQIDPNHCIRSDESITFWPLFGSKTDCTNYRQSGWKLLSNKNNRRLDPVFWLNKTITLLHERRDTAKTFNLFVTLRGQAKPASRTIIAGWVKSLFKEAEITATPGSVRSAVASKSWLENHPLDEILTRGNWRSANTFKQFYKREVIKNINTKNITRLFDPID
ncbi:uncharacterized protein LOC114356488 isoform X1 [Ostrinia furnacalis]|uniref:uncharacterized protein LOC114350004 isoform X1 n=1 Tax=Ostrinia furnacalis TaxID=93504 RepID=UPI00103F27D5|nr:uncharacterized protein LOC114350004 isoform X1 [Ostrinia furnacalis]XP_028165500.1 uncharacterized protein LOC114356488 isoform X1 [Ostrinia furnacalis]